jgi:hypothetical protein
MWFQLRKDDVQFKTRSEKGQWQKCHDFTASILDIKKRHGADEDPAK